MKTTMKRTLVVAFSDSEGDVGVTTCLGLWGTCTLPDGTESKAPAVHVTL